MGQKIAGAALRFSQPGKFPRFQDRDYHQIVDAVAGLRQLIQRDGVDDGLVRNCIYLMSPLLLVRDYKSQARLTSEPVDLKSLVDAYISLLKSDLGRDNHDDIGRRFVEATTTLPGIGLPMASAYLHFAYPDLYPIVDRYVVSSLRSDMFRDVPGFHCPRGLASHKGMNASLWAERYLEQKRALDSIIGAFKGLSYRDLDKALMVLGSGA
ncbi:hypothetical protein K3217_21105 [bacterium BD-1]|nr:hypothetical protein [Ottowia caeni]